MQQFLSLRLSLLLPLLLLLSGIAQASPAELPRGTCFTPGWTTHSLLKSMESVQYHLSAEQICTNVLACTTTVTPTVTCKATVTRTSFTKTTLVPHFLQTRTSTVDSTYIITPSDATLFVPTPIGTETVVTGTSTSWVTDTEPTTEITALDEVYITTSTDFVTSITSTITSYTSTTVEADYTTTSTNVISTATSTSTSTVTASTEVDPTTVDTELVLITQMSTTTDSTSYSSFTSYISTVTVPTAVSTDLLTVTTETDYLTSYTGTSTVLETVETDVSYVVTTTRYTTKTSVESEPTTLSTTIFTTVATSTTTVFTTTVTVDVFNRRAPVPAVDCDTALQSIWLHSYGASQLASACSCIVTALPPTHTVTHKASTVTQTITDNVYAVKRVTSDETRFITKSLWTTGKPIVLSSLNATDLFLVTASQATDTVLEGFTSTVDVEDEVVSTTTAYYTIDAASTTTIGAVATAEVDIDATFLTNLFESTLLGAVETEMVDFVASTELDVTATTLTPVTATTTATTVAIVPTNIVLPSEIDLISTELDGYTETIVSDVAVTSIDLLEASTTVPTTVTTVVSIGSTSTQVAVVVSNVPVTTVTSRATVDVVSSATATVLATATCTSNPVVNGGFDSGQLSPWYIGPKSTYSASVVFFGGSYVLETSNMHDVLFCTVQQNLNTCVGATYTCSVQVYIENYYTTQYGPPAIIAVLVLPANGGDLVLSSYSMTGPSSAGVYHTMNFHFTGTGNDVLGFQMYSPQTAATGTNYFILDSIVCSGS